MTITADRDTIIRDKAQKIAGRRTVATLTGTPKQIAWATDIRARAIVGYEISFGPVAGVLSDGTEDITPGILAPAEYDATLGLLLRIANADWWITHRYDSARQLLTIAKGLLNR